MTGPAMVYWAATFFIVGACVIIALALIVIARKDEPKPVRKPRPNKFYVVMVKEK